MVARELLPSCPLEGCPPVDRRRRAIQVRESGHESIGSLGCEHRPEEVPRQIRPTELRQRPRGHEGRGRVDDAVDCDLAVAVAIALVARCRGIDEPARAGSDGSDRRQEQGARRDFEGGGFLRSVVVVSLLLLRCRRIDGAGAFAVHGS